MMWDAAGVYTIGHAARLTGVPSATLRVWERRYGLVTPVRSEGGYRLYDEKGLQLLRAMGALVAGGWSARQAAEHLRSEGSNPLPDDQPAALDPGSARQGRDADAVLMGASGAWDVTALARGAAEMDPAAVAEAVDQALAAGSLEQAIDTWMMPALHLLGTQWSAGRVDVAGEHIVSATLQRRLGAEMERAPRAPQGPRVAVGLPRGSRHELGILAFSVVLRRAGVDVVYLGSDLPVQDWVAVVERHRPEVVVIGVPTPTDVLAVRETVAALRAARPQLPVHVGGSAQAEVGQGTLPLGDQVAAAAQELAAALLAPPTG